MFLVPSISRFFTYLPLALGDALVVLLVVELARRAGATALGCAAIELLNGLLVGDDLLEVGCAIMSQHRTVAIKL